jgi:LAS superfamily LD-carboxypeptidase LdcB
MKISLPDHITQHALAISWIIVLVVCTRIGYGYLQTYTENILLKIAVAELQKTTEVQKEHLAILKGKNASTTSALQVEKANNDFFQGQIQNISNTVGVLEKLSKTDSKLLEKYSKVYFLNENYVPEKLTLIDQKYWNVKNKPLEIHTDILPHLQKMIDDATIADNTVMQILSAYRSFGTQAGLKATYKVTYGTGTANAFSAEQGYSEHQLGTTVDFTTPTIGTGLAGFEKTTAYTWLVNNAYKYGFVLSYPKNNTYYVYEPWHWRFVGVALATKLHNENKYFYDLDQREINQFLVNIFD